MKRRIGFLILLSVVSLFSISGIVLASDGKPSSYSEKIEAKLQAAVDAGKLTQEQADAKLQAIADGKTRMKKGNHWHKKGFGSFKGKLGKGSRT